MIKNIELKKPGGNGSGDGTVAWLLTTMSIIALYVITIAVSVVYSLSSSKERVALTGRGGVAGEHYYIKVVFYNLEVGGPSTQIEIEDFEMHANGQVYKALNFDSNGTTYTLLRDEEEKFVNIEFNDIDTTGSEKTFFYKGVKLKTKGTSLVTMLFPIIVLETIAFAIIMVTALGVIRIINEKKLKTNSIKVINEKALEYLAAEKFNITKTFYMKSPRTGARDIEKFMICIDSGKRCFAFVDYAGKRLRIVDFEDFVNYKIIENDGVSVESKNKFSMFLDTSYTSTSTRNICKKLQLVLIVNDPNDTNIVYEFVKSGVSSDSSIYKDMSNSLIEVTSYFEIIKKNPTKKKNYAYCKYCGVKNKEDASHCIACGGVLKD